jgi:ribonucleoside-diphosphate reductase alpha chain
MSLDNSSCNLASLNLLKFLKDDDTFDAERSPRPSSSSSPRWTSRSASPTSRPRPIGDTTRAYRQLGIGYANLGALLMATGLPYDSDGGRALAARSPR